MTTFAELMNRVRIAATSPDGNVRAQVAADFSSLSIAFRPGSFTTYSSAGLAEQLSRLGERSRQAVEDARTQAYRAAEDAGNDDASGDRPHWDKKRRDYQSALDALDVRAFSEKRLLRIRCRGLRQWQVELKPDALKQLDEKGLIAEFASAFRRLMADQQFKAVLTRTGHFDYGIYPPSMREHLTELREKYL